MARSLRTYRGMRDFQATPEPSGEVGEGTEEPRFVVQEHHARSLHWDLRLERDGVLVSWAVPKGIPDDPSDNRLAVHVEDHPLDYIDFAGEIPEGSYGAGKVSIWDLGTYECHKFRPDEVIVTFHGERLSGRYVLFQTRGKNWMIHRMDPPAEPGREPMPARVEPMLARAGTLPRDPEAWGFEVKWDGVRAVGYIDGGRLRLESRNGKDLTDRYPELRELGRTLGSRRAILDGEIVAFDDAGRPSFQRLQERMHLASDAAVRRKARDTPVTYVLFDVLYSDHRSTTGLPYAERRELLDGLGLNGPAWQTPPAHPGAGQAMVEATRAQGLEGVIAKRLDSRYEPGRRSGSWLKVKNVRRQEVVIGGWLPGEGRRRGRIGALLVGVHAEERLRYAGRVGTGLGEDDLRVVAVERSDSPFEGRQPPKGAVFVEPRLVCEVEFTEWTRAGTLRHPSFKGLRYDTEPEEVVAEPVAGAPAPARTGQREDPADGGRELQRLLRAGRPRSRTAEVELEGRKLKLSNLDKPMYPAVGFSKGQVIDYYARIAPAVLPHLRDRPLTLKRYPDGVEGQYFYEKQCPSHRPDWVRTQAIFSGHRGKAIDFCVVDDLPTLVWAANLADLELHTSMALATRIERPTMMVFDLDPGAPAALLECCEVALWLRAMLDALALRSFPKTSGSKGLQVYVPLNTAVTYDHTKPFAQALAQLLEKREPGKVVSRMKKELRGGKVLVDWSQNDEHKTTVCAYSLRARERPTVSTPVEWAEVEDAHSRGDAESLVFDADDVLARVQERGDLFAPVLELRQELPELSGAR